MDGTPFGRYKLVELLGRGGMGDVWRAYDTVTDRVVAVKVLPAHLADDQTFQERFRREARAAAGLNNPHVVPIHDFGEIDGRLFVDMRLIEGEDLGTLLRSGPLPPQRAIKIIEQIALALFAAHRIGLVHRDVKPSNILVTEDDFAYLIDFGIARAAGEAGLTDTGAAVGTWAYMAPERFSTGAADARADVYALTCVLYEALTGESPFPATTLEQIATAHMLQPPPKPSTVRPQIPQAMDQVITTGMAKEPDQRYASTKDLATAARAAVGAEQDRTQAAQQDHTQAVPRGVDGAADRAAEPARPDHGGPATRTHRASASTRPGGVRRRNSVPNACRAGSAPAVGPTRSSGPSSGRRRNILLASAAALLVVIVAVAAVIMFSGDSDSPSSNTASSSSPSPAAPSPSSEQPTAPGGGMFNGPQPWTADVSGAPKSDRSDAIIGALSAAGGWGTDNRLQIDFSNAIFFADGSTPRMQVVGTEDYCGGGPDCDPVPAEMPVPENANIGGSPDLQCDITGNTEGQGDCQLLVVDREGQKLYETYQSTKEGDGLKTAAFFVWDLNKQYPDNLRGDQCTSADAGGFPISAMTPTADEVASGSIDHAIRFILPNDRMRAGVYVHPASHAGGPESARPQCAALRRAVPAEGRLRRDGLHRLAESGDQGSQDPRDAAGRRRPGAAHLRRRSDQHRQMGGFGNRLGYLPRDHARGIRGRRTRTRHRADVQLRP